MDDQLRNRASPLHTLVPQDIAVHSTRLILTRWAAGVLVLAATAFCVGVFGLPLPVSLYLLGAAILGYNSLLAWLAQRLRTDDYELFARRMRRFVLLQVALDWLSMAVFLHLTGGVTSPGIAFFFLHVLMVTILLPGQSPYIYAVLAVGVVSLIAMLEAIAILPHYTVIPGLSPALYTNSFFALAQIIFFAVTLLATVYLTSSIMARLRERDRQVAALFQTTDDVSSTLELSEVLKRLAYSAAETLSVPGASIRLLDPGGERLSMVASHGLSRMYLDKGPVQLSQSLLDREALAGQAVIIHEAATDPRVQYPKEVAEEGIHSMLVVPIIGRRPLGVLRVYSWIPGRFSSDDAEFVLAIARQGATAIANALAHEELQKADQDREMFIRMVTHELRAPVTGSQSLIRVLLRNLAGDLSEQQRDIVARIEARLDSLLALINDLLTFAAGKAIGLNLSLTPQPVNQVLAHVVERFASQAEEKGIHLNTQIEPGEVVACATEEGLARLFDNLVGNAVKYTPSGGAVNVRLQTEANCVVIVVADTGIGISASVIDRLGDEFFRAENAREAGIMGTGLGLAIVRQLIDAFGGIMSIKSAEGQGSTFTVSLPLADPEALAQHDSCQPSPE